ncbi:SDR family NAD(P)-dependent oxidoreductase [Mycolicibacterium thermoresistibile]
MTGLLTGKVAIVLGAGRGIGAAIAQRFADEGASVVVADVSERWAGKTATAIGSAALPMQCDVSDEDAVAATLAAVVDQLGGLDVVVNNAALGHGGPITEIARSDWDRVLAITLNGTFHATKHAVPHLRRRGGGAIINISSVAGRAAMSSMAAYSVAKAGVDALTRTAAAELRPDNIRVNAIVPGMIRTAAATASAEVLAPALRTDVESYVAQRQHRWGEPEEVAAVAAHLASDDASFTTGMFYLLDNGATLLP